MAWVGRLVTRSIASPLNKAGQVFVILEQGDFDTPINAEGDDELSLLMQSLKGMQGKLKQNLTEQQTLAKQVQEQASAFQAQLNAISKSTGMLEMDADGNVLNTNELFLNSFGYAKEELIGKNHEIFVQHEGVDLKQNADIWEKLKRGQSDHSTNQTLQQRRQRNLAGCDLQPNHRG